MRILKRPMSLLPYEVSIEIPEDLTRQNLGDYLRALGIALTQLERYLTLCHCHPETGELNAETIAQDTDIDMLKIHLQRDDIKPSLTPLLPGLIIEGVRQDIDGEPVIVACLIINEEAEEEILFEVSFPEGKIKISGIDEEVYSEFIGFIENNSDEIIAYFTEVSPLIPFPIQLGPKAPSEAKEVADCTEDDEPADQPRAFKRTRRDDPLPTPTVIATTQDASFSRATFFQSVLDSTDESNPFVSRCASVGRNSI